MPELPEVETVRLQLLQVLKGKTIDWVEELHKKTTRDTQQFADRLHGKQFVDITRVGKLLIFAFADDSTFLLAHLKMTGQFFYVDHDEQVVGGGHSLDDKSLLHNNWPHKHTRTAFYLTDGTALYFNDMRLFGYLKLVTAREKDTIIKKFGPEPHSVEFDDAAFIARLQKRRVSIKAALLDQSLIAGLGNIYVDETLWRAKIAPDRRANTLSQEEIVSIRRYAKKVLNEAIGAGGTTFRSFSDTAGKAGSYMKKLKVFQKNGQPCSRCGTRIIKTRVAGRGTHWCPQCQK